METAILTTQTKGQITLPKAWRDKMNTEVFQATYNDNMIMLTPVQIADSAAVKKLSLKFIKENKELLLSLANK